MNRSKNYSPPAMWVRGLLLLALVAGVDSCSSDPVDLSPVDPGGGSGTGGSGAQGHGPELVDLGTAGTYVILAKEATTNVPTSDITGNIGLSPAAASFYSGFAQNLPAGGAFSTSPQVTGNIYASDYAVPTPANLTTAISDMETAYTDAAGRPLPDHIELASGNLGGLTLPAGLYKWSNTVTIPGNVTLNGNANDVWIFQIAGGITQASAARVVLTGGAVAEHVFWQVAGVVAIGTTAHMEGVVMSATQITMNTGATANGRLLAQTAITLAGNTIVEH
jgi:Ice-binding-like